MKKPIREKLLLEIAQTHGTPVYVYDLRTLREKIEILRKHTTGISVQLLYAMKANSLPSILEVVHDEGLGVDAVSPAELELALRLGFDRGKIFYSANNMTDAEMHRAVSAGVTVNVGELSRLRRLGVAYPQSRICVRLNSHIGAGHHPHVITAGTDSKFGISIGQIEEVLEIAERFNVRIVGLHQHIGSGILETEVVWKAISVLLEAGLKFKDLTFMNLGGGLGIPYRPEDRPLDMHAWASVIIEPLQRFARSHSSDKLRFLFEPGRFLVAESGTLLVRVNTLKNANGKTFAGVDSGMGHLVRPALYGAYHAVFNLSNPGGAPGIYDLVGNICESADFFASERAIQEIREGDILAIMDTGAYGMSMASNYNLRPLPAEVTIDEREAVNVVTKRETAEEMISRLYPELPASAP